MEMPLLVAWQMDRLCPSARGQVVFADAQSVGDGGNVDRSRDRLTEIVLTVGLDLDNVPMSH